MTTTQAVFEFNGKTLEVIDLPTRRDLQKTAVLYATAHQTETQNITIRFQDFK